MANPTDRRYSKEHEWALAAGDTVTVGISDYAQEQLTDIVFVELPELGRQVKAGDAVAVLESVKSVADVYAPCDGEVSEINAKLEEHPEQVNEDAFGEGWLFRLKAPGPDLSAMMDAEAYQQFTDSE